MSVSYEIEDLSTSFGNHPPQTYTNIVEWVRAKSRHDDDGVELILFIVIFGLIACCVCCCSKSRNMHRVMRKLPTITPSLMHMYEGKAVKVIGRAAHNGQLLAAPFSGRPCLAYEVKVTERKTKTRYRNGKWETYTTTEQVAYEQNSTEFLVTECAQGGGSVSAVCWVPGTGVSMVGGGFMTNFSLTLHCEKDTFNRSGLFNNATANCEAFLRRHGQSSTGFLWLNRDLSYSEGAVQCGEVVGVCGMVKRLQGPNGPVWTIAPLQRTQIDESEFSCLERNALSNLDGTILVTDDHSVIGYEAVQDVMSRPAPIYNMNMQPSAPEFQYFEPQKAPPPSYSVTVTVQMQQQAGITGGYQYAHNPAYTQQPAVVPPTPPSNVNVHINTGYVPPQQPHYPYATGQQQPAYGTGQQQPQNPYATGQPAYGTGQNPYNQNAANPHAQHEQNPYAHGVPQQHTQQQGGAPGFNAYGQPNPFAGNQQAPPYSPTAPPDNSYFQMK